MLMFNMLMAELENLLRYRSRIVDINNQLVKVIDYNSLKTLVERYKKYHEKLQHNAEEKRVLHLQDNEQPSFSPYLFREEPKD